MNEDRLKLSLLIDEAQDAEQLARLIAYAAAHPDKDVQALRLKAIKKQMQLRKGVASAGNGPRHFALGYGIARTLHAPLYRYGLKDEAFARLQSDVAVLARRGSIGYGHGPALFVLWAADWFRRHYRGDGLKWQRLIDVLDAPLNKADLPDIAKQGLVAWNRPLKRSVNERRYFIGTLAREGGFPVAAVEQGGKGWARDLLAGIVAPLLADPAADLAQAELFAARQCERITARLFNDDEFASLCADLALAIAKVRREADGPAQAAGIPVAAWLQHHRPDWKDALPLSVSGPGGDALLGELLKVEAAAVTGLNAGVERLLVRGADGRWSEAARLTLDGRMAGSLMKDIPADIGRLRLFASGALARAAPGELAMLEPPGQGESGWLALSTHHARQILPVPFATTAEVDLRSGDKWVGRVLLPNGKPRRGQLLVCSVAKGADDAPEHLKVEGSGSGAFAAEIVIIQVPNDWRVSVSTDGVVAEEVTPLGAGVGDTSLWRVRGGAFITNPDDDCYRIHTGQKGDQRNRLEFYGSQPGWAQVVGDIDLFHAGVSVRTSDPGRGALFMRAIGSRDWRRAPSPLPVGHYDIGWRDSLLLLDRRRIAVVPANARISRSGMGMDTRYALTEWGSVTITPGPDAPVRAIDDGWRAKPRGMTRATFWFDAAIGWPDGPDLPVRIDYPCQASIARWDGALLPGDSHVTLAELRDLVAVDGGNMRLFAELVDGKVDGAASAMTWQFRGEMPLSSAAADIASLLLPASGDAQVKLGMLDGIETYWHVRQYAVHLERQAGGLVASAAIAAPDVHIWGRSLANPAEEVDFGAYSLLVEANHRPFTLPPQAGGSWIIYLRDGPIVLSRPILFDGPGKAPEPTTLLTRTLQIPPWQGLEAALHTVLQAAVDDDAIIAELNILAASLNGLHPWWLYVLRLLPDHPAVLARMAFAATTEQRPAILALSDALPFAWCLIPRSVWENAFHDALARSSAAIVKLGIANAMNYAMAGNASIITALAAQEPLLEHILKTGLPVAAKMDIAQSLIRTAADDDNVKGYRSRYREQGLAMPAQHLDLPPNCLELLDTPHAAALAVAGAWTPKADDVRHIKAVARNFPTYFADAFALSLKELN